MKKYLLITLSASTLLMSCERFGCKDPNALNYDHRANVDNGSCKYAPNDPNNPPVNAVLFSADFNYVDRNEQVSVQFDSGFSSGTDIGALEYQGDSVLSLSFINSTTNRQFDLSLSTHGGNTIVPGTYTFTENSPNHSVGANTFFYASSNPPDQFVLGPISGGLSYQNVLTPRSGQITITSITNNSIQGTISGNFYGENDGGTLNYNSKLVITNGQFNCGLFHY